MTAQSINDAFSSFSLQDLLRPTTTVRFGSMEWRDLHDAILETVRINWGAKTCEFQIRGHLSAWLVQIKNFSDLKLPREEPWGPSISINEVVQDSAGLKIEMQSGDILTARGEVEIRSIEIATIKPDVLAEIELFATSNGGRKESTPATFLGCPVQIGTEHFDCRIFFEGKPMSPGESRQKVKVCFLSPQLVKGLLKVGQTFTLWEGKNIGVMKVNEVFI